MHKMEITLPSSNIFVIAALRPDIAAFDWLDLVKLMGLINVDATSPKLSFVYDVLACQIMK